MPLARSYQACFLYSEEESAADIDYIDYGNSEHVNKSRLCTEFPEEFQQYPIMALKCQLSGIRPVGSSTDMLLLFSSPLYIDEMRISFKYNFKNRTVVMLCKQK